MSEQIKMTDEELKSIQDLQTSFQEKIVQFGKLYLEKMNIENAVREITEKEMTLKDDWKSLQIKETELVNQILKTYGEGSIDIKNGIFHKE